MKKEKIEVRTWQLKQITEALEKALVNKPKKFWHVEFPGKTLSWLKIFEDKLPCDSKDSGSFNPSNLDKTSIDFVSVDKKGSNVSEKKLVPTRINMTVVSHFEQLFFCKTEKASNIDSN